MYQAGSFPKGAAINNPNKRPPQFGGNMGTTSNPVLKSQLGVQPRQGPPPSLGDKNKNYLLKEVDDELRKLKTQFEMIKNDPYMPKQMSSQGFDSMSSATMKGSQGTVSAVTGIKMANTQPLPYNAPIGSHQPNGQVKPMGIQGYGQGRPAMPVKKQQLSAPTLPEPNKNTLINPQNTSKIGTSVNASSGKESPQKNPQSVNASRDSQPNAQSLLKTNTSEVDKQRPPQKPSPPINTSAKFGTPSPNLKTTETTSPITNLAYEAKTSREEVRPPATSLKGVIDFKQSAQQIAQQSKPSYQQVYETQETSISQQYRPQISKIAPQAQQTKQMKQETADNSRRPPPAKPAKNQTQPLKTETQPQKLKDSPINPLPKTKDSPSNQNSVAPPIPTVSQYNTYQSYQSQRIRYQPPTQQPIHLQPAQQRQFSPSQHQRNLSIRKHEAKKIAQQEQKINALSKTSDTLVKQNLQLKYQVNKLTQDNKLLNRLKAENQALQNTTRQAQQKYLKMQSQYEQMSVTLSKKEAIIADLEVEISRMKTTLESSNTGEGGFNMALKSQLEQNQRIKERFRQKDEEIDHLRSLNQTIKSQLDNLRNDIDIQKLKRMAQLKNQQTTFDIELQTLITENTSYKKTVSALDQKFKFMLKADRKKDQFMAHFLKGKATDPNDKEIIDDFFKQFEQVPKLTISQLLKQQYMLQDQLRKQIQHLKKSRY